MEVPEIAWRMPQLEQRVCLFVMPVIPEHWMPCAAEEAGPFLVLVLEILALDFLFSRMEKTEIALLDRQAVMTAFLYVRSFIREVLLLLV